MSAPDVVTFGCRLNAFESEVMREIAGDLDDTVIVNTCAVTGEAERQARQAIRRIRRERPQARIVVTGCAAQIAPERFAAMPEVDRVIGNREKLESESYAADAIDRVSVGDLDRAPAGGSSDRLLKGFGARTRAFVQVQTGCDHRCTFCIIPYGRGPSRSVPEDAIAAQLRALVANGIREVVLTGVDLTAYGADLPAGPRLGAMVRRLLAAVPDLPRLRLSSIDVAEIDAELYDVIADEPRLMPHLHLSLQSGDDMVLKRMKRRHSRADAVAFAARVRRARPEIALGADLIAGFPTETDAMFDRTLSLVDEVGLAYLHVFPFSARPTTPAARMPQVPGAIRRERAERLRAAGEGALARHLSARLGTSASILVETDRFGRDRDFAPVRLDRPSIPGRIVEARLDGMGEKELHARLAA
ncbi:MAG: tRNA (N(6)-L-threonylcarbamoyladenosine(37)-C(2))-methylthiotransferase MtaB [Alphaproteobacteria bacterium]